MLGSVLFWDITQHRVAIPTQPFGRPIGPICKAFLLDYLTLTDETNRLSLNTGKELPL